MSTEYLLQGRHYSKRKTCINSSLPPKTFPQHTLLSCFTEGESEAQRVSNMTKMSVSYGGGGVIEDLHAGNWTPLCILNPISVGAAAPSQDISLKIILEEEKFK